MMKKLFWRFFFVASVLLTCFGPWQVHAGKGDVDVTTLTAEVAALKTAVDNHGTSLATIKTQVDEVVTTVQTMNGDINKNAKKMKDQDAVIKDLQTRSQVLEDQIYLVTGQLQELKAEGLLSPKATQRIDEFKNYSRGLEFMNAKQFGKTIQEMSTFQQTYPKSPFVSYAQFWIGEAYYRQADYPMAIKQYQKVMNDNPRSAKAPTALYRQGLAFYYLQSFDDAKDFFSKVIRTYPQTIEAIQSSSQIARIENIQKLKKQEDFEKDLID